MTEPQTEAGRALLAWWGQKLDGTEPSTRHLHRPESGMALAILAIEHQAVERFRAEAIAAVETARLREVIRFAEAYDEDGHPHASNALKDRLRALALPERSQPASRRRCHPAGPRMTATNA